MHLHVMKLCHCFCVIDKEICPADAEGRQVTGIRPWGGTLQYTSPQHLRAMQRQAELEGSREQRQSPAGRHDMQHLDNSQTADHKMSKFPSWWQKALCCTGRYCKHGNSHNEHEYACDDEESHEPELLIDGRAADMWSCGVLLYELVSTTLSPHIQGVCTCCCEASHTVLCTTA